MYTNNNPIYATAVPVEEAAISTKTARDSKLPATPQKIANNAVSQNMANQLMDQGFTSGLANSFTRNKQSFPLRIWIIDNSGSMNRPDGHRIVATDSRSDIRFVPCTRWEEIRETTRYHINLAGLVEAPTRFRLLNDPGSFVGAQRFSVADDPSNEDELPGAPQDIAGALRIMAVASPTGATPLTAHIVEIQNTVSRMARDLRRQGQRVVIVIATDGLPTDEYGMGGAYQKSEFVKSLRMLEGLPIWLVIRLCTDEEEVVDFYNNLDEQLELSLDVLDDFCAEAAEVYEHNKWLNYALPLHRLREMGFYHRTFDLIDERALTKTELREFMGLLFGEETLDGVPDPSVDWMGFSLEVQRMLKQEQLQWNPIKKTMTPWIDMRMMDRQYGPKGCGIGCTIM